MLPFYAFPANNDEIFFSLPSVKYIVFIQLLI